MGPKDHLELHYLADLRRLDPLPALRRPEGASGGLHVDLGVCFCPLHFFGKPVFGVFR